MVDEHKCFRKGGKRKLLVNPFGDGDAINADYNIRAKQFGAFAALRGFEALIRHKWKRSSRMTDEKYAGGRIVNDIAWH